MSDRDDELEEEPVPGPDEHEDDDDLPPGDDEVDPPPLEADDDTEDDDEVVEPRGRKPGSEKFRELRRRAQDAEDRARRAEEAAYRAEGAASFAANPRRDPEADRRAEEERVNAMTPEQRADYRADQVRNETQRNQAQSEFRTTDRLDRIEFDNLCGRNKAYASVAKDVEDELKKLRARGQNVDRKVIANVMLGERAAKRAEGGGRERQQGDRQRPKQARRGGGESDVAPVREGGRSRAKGKTAAERLEGVKF